MKDINSEVKKVVKQVKTAQAKLQAALKDKTWVEDARKYAERQGKEVRKLLEADVTKVVAFVERERKELEKIQKQIPGEVKKLRKFVNGQRKELERLLTSLRKGKARASSSGKSSGTKKARKKSSDGASAHSSS